MSSGSSEFDPVNQLAEEFVERYRRGERPSVTEYAQRHLADRIRDVFPALVVVEEFASVGGQVPVGRISFIDAVRWLADAIHGVVELKLRLVPHRPGRFEPRAVKRRPKEYDRLNQPRDVLRKRLLSKKHAANFMPF
jgi:hypothetical protein